MSDADIHFGDLEESAPDKSLRPDRNKHYAVASYESPEENELPIFLDLDVMRDMEVHAASDKTVELGGVLLGGQFEDEDGKPFVVISDSLRAEHYESTKGSFKFTHDTWSKISREREEFPDDLQMVGWYHTHPDWGVFLSGMDMFICDNFFNRPLDVAYVIDPCRQDRAFFEWTGNASQRIRRLGGFYVIASRFRQQELEFYTAQLEGGMAMSGQQFGPYPQPVVNIHEQRQSWQGIAVLGMLSIQFLFLALIAWKMLGGEKDKKERNDLAVRLQIQNDLIDEIVAAVPKGDKGFRDKLQEKHKKNIELESANTGLKYAVEKLEKDRATAEGSVTKLTEKLDAAKKQTKRDKDKLADRKKEITELKKQIGEEGGTVTVWKKWGFPVGIGAIVGLLVVAGYSATMSMKNQEEEFEADGLPVPDAEAVNGDDVPSKDDSDDPPPVISE